MGLFFGAIALAILLSCVVGVISYASLPECPFCHSKGSFAHRYRRVDGGPDRRFGNNPVVCLKCGKKRGEQPLSPEKSAELEHWKKHGFDMGRSGQPNNIPAEIRPLAGSITPLSSAWNLAWNEGNRQYMWEQGFADGLAGRPHYIDGYNAWRAQAWQEGDAKRKRLHYFPSPNAKEKIKD